MELPTYQCRQAVVTNAVKTAVNGISACAPEGSGVATTINVCAGEQTIWLAFINQIKVAFCYVFGVLVDILATLENFPLHDGTPTVEVSDAAGTGATATLLDGSTDTQGAVAITIGTTPTPEGGVLAVLTFGTDFAAQIYPVVSILNDTAQSGLGAKTVIAGGPTTPISELALVAQYPLGGTGTLGDGDTLIITYKIGFTA